MSKAIVPGYDLVWWGERTREPLKPKAHDDCDNARFTNFFEIRTLPVSEGFHASSLKPTMHFAPDGFNFAFLESGYGLFY